MDTVPGCIENGRKDTGQKRGFFEFSGFAEMLAAFSAVLFLAMQLGDWFGVFGVMSNDERKPNFDLSSDPKVGTKVSLPSTDVYGRSLLPDREGRVMLIAAGACTDCSLDAFSSARFDHERFARVILVFESPSSQIGERARSLPETYRVVSDKDLELRKKLNVAWHPRFYELSAKLSVMSIQKTPDRVPVEYNRSRRK